MPGMTAPSATDPLRAWREQLEAWAIPEEILAAVPDSPWELPVGLFRSRADRLVAVDESAGMLEAFRAAAAAAGVAAETVQGHWPEVAARVAAADVVVCHDVLYNVQDL